MLRIRRKLTSILLSACGMAFAVPCHAGYRLNGEVKNPTPALQEAAEIGVRLYNNEAMQDLPDKDAMVVMSFGTTMKETRDKTINATVEEIQKALPGVKVVIAYTSHIIIDRIKAKEGVVIPTPEEALEQLQAEGYTRIALASLDIIPGMEYDYKTGIFKRYRNRFKKMTMGLPLLFWQGQENQRDDVAEVVEAFATQFPTLGSDEALLVMTHGTPHPSNAFYAVIQDRLNRLERGHIHVYSVEGMPMLEHVIPVLKEEGVKHVTLMPMMMVAGDHANNDMAGDDDDSHKVILQKEGFAVTPYIHGMGENAAVRGIFVERALESWDALQNLEEGRTGGMKH
ncbi:MAG: sirohydrochlorin cobaltochelatase [Acidaminococcaceae bacterium]|nr:sirohydrochlorin cobaltochelatase [Acidaminococcaceae bacterium]